MNHSSSSYKNYDEKDYSVETMSTTHQELVPTLQQASKNLELLNNSKDNEYEADELRAPNSQLQRLGLKTLIKIIAIAISPLAVLMLGKAVYQSPSQPLPTIDTVERADADKYRRLSPILWIGTGTLLSGALAALWASRSIRLATITATVAKEREARKELEERSRLLANAIGKIRASVNQGDILQTAVAETRRAIAADRVLFYSLDEQSQGRVIAESVASGYPQALDATIEDPCFNAHYLEKYQNGRIQAIDDIYQANLTPCHLSQLEPFAVKANLVAPILNQGKLMGLLIAHHCAAPHSWQQSEMDLVAQIAFQTGLVLDNVKLLADSTRLQQQKETEIQRIQSLTKATENIRASVNQGDILQTAVAETRRAIAADRVLFYSLDEQSQGRVIAESVAPGYPEALGANIIDPCFNAHYLEKYQSGRIQALDDIYQANLTPCHLGQLEPFAVKANLVVPVLNQGKLMGLLIVHHCAAPHSWQQSEIDVVAQIAFQTGLVLDNVKLLADSTRLLEQKETEIQRIQSLTKATENIHASVNQGDILQTAVAETRHAIAADRVLVYSLDEQSQGRVIAESVAPGYPKALGANIIDSCFNFHFLEKYQNDQIQAIDDIYQADLTPSHLAQLEQFAVKANLVAPILNQGKLMGLLIAHHCAAPHSWQQFEINWFMQIARQVSFAIDNARLLREIAQASQAFLSQIPAVADFAQSAIANAQEAQLEVEQTSQMVEAGYELADRTREHLVELQGNMVQAAMKIKYLGQSSRKISQLVALVDSLAAQINLQGMNMIFEANRHKDIAQRAVNSPLAETMYSLREQLAEATAEIKSSADKIKTETNNLASTMDTRTEKFFQGNDLVAETKQQLNSIDNYTSKMNSLLSNIVQATVQGVQASTSTSQSILQNTNLVNYSSEQSQAIANSLTKLGKVAQELEASLGQIKPLNPMQSLDMDVNHQHEQQNFQDERDLQS